MALVAGEVGDADGHVQDDAERDEQLRAPCGAEFLLRRRQLVYFFSTKSMLSLSLRILICFSIINNSPVFVVADIVFGVAYSHSLFVIFSVLTDSFFACFWRRVTRGFEKWHSFNGIGTNLRHALMLREAIDLPENETRHL